MDNVYDQAAEYFGTTNGIILGSLYADCKYLSLQEYNSLDLTTDARFTWLTDMRADTTTTTSNCAFDR